MRPIKFRGRALHPDRKGEWLYGNIIKLQLDEERGPRYYIAPQNDVEPYLEGGESLVSDWDEVDPVTVGQLAGLPDKNGKEIYEGDILYRCTEIKDMNLEFKNYVEWIPDSTCFGLKPSTPYAFTDLTTERGLTLEVIGDIHSNPELLTTP